jgi:hypothetical protein
MRNVVVPFLLALTSVVVSAAGPDAKYKGPRNVDGRPDLQGVWNFSSDVPLQRPTAFAEKPFFTREELAQQRAARRTAFETMAKLVPIEAVALTWLDYDAHAENLRTSLITHPENGRLPQLAEGVRRMPGADEIFALLTEAKGTLPPALAAALATFGGGKKDGPEDFGTSDRCLGGSATPLVPGFDSNYLQIVQSSDEVALLTESGHLARMVPLDGRPHVGEKLRSWTGDSRGHWEGDTLVVETRNFNKRTQSFAGAGNSYDKVVTERFTRIAPNVLDYEATVVDPKTFQDKVVVSFPMARVEGGRIYETACHEGNYSLPMMLAGARREEQAVK